MRSKTIQNTKKSLSESKIVTFFLFLFFLVLVISLFRNFSKLRLAHEIIEAEKESNEKIAEEIALLHEELGEVRSEEFLERQLRDGLGMAKKGEVVLVMPDPEYVKSLVALKDANQEEKEKPNWQKWVDIFL